MAEAAAGVLYGLEKVVEGTVLAVKGSKQIDGKKATRTMWSPHGVYIGRMTICRTLPGLIRG